MRNLHIARLYLLGARPMPRSTHPKTSTNRPGKEFKQVPRRLKQDGKFE